MYRVKEIDGIFIPQKFIFVVWLGIDKKNNNLWYYFNNQKIYCRLYSLESARERIKRYKIQESTPKVKYYKEK